METVEIAGLKVPKSNKKFSEPVFTSNLVETETTIANLRNILYPLMEGSPVRGGGDAGVRGMGQGAEEGQHEPATREGGDGLGSGTSSSHE